MKNAVYALLMMMSLSALWGSTSDDGTKPTVVTSLQAWQELTQKMDTAALSLGRSITYQPVSIQSLKSDPQGKNTLRTVFSMLGESLSFLSPYWDGWCPAPGKPLADMQEILSKPPMPRDVVLSILAGGGADPGQYPILLVIAKVMATHANPCFQMCETAPIFPKVLKDHRFYGVFLFCNMLKDLAPGLATYLPDESGQYPAPLRTAFQDLCKVVLDVSVNIEARGFLIKCMMSIHNGKALRQIIDTFTQEERMTFTCVGAQIGDFSLLKWCFPQKEREFSDFASGTNGLTFIYKPGPTDHTAALALSPLVRDALEARMAAGKNFYVRFAPPTQQ